MSQVEIKHYSFNELDREAKDIAIKSFLATYDFDKNAQIDIEERLMASALSVGIKLYCCYDSSDTNIKYVSVALHDDAGDICERIVSRNIEWLMPATEHGDDSDFTPAIANCAQTALANLKVEWHSDVAVTWNSGMPPTQKSPYGDLTF